MNNHAHVLKFPDIETQEFVSLYLNLISLEPFVSGMAQPKLNQAQLNRIPIPYPQSSKRSEIVVIANALRAKSDELSSQYSKSIRDISDLRQSLLQKAFAGELT